MTHDTPTLQALEQTTPPDHYREIERQFTTDYPAAFEYMRGGEDAEAITHLYLSYPSEEFNLRVSEVVTRDGRHYRGTLKDRGELTSEGLNRLEIETEISEAAFRFYESRGTYATLRKLRVRPATGVTIDWYAEEEPPVIEVEEGPDKQGAAEFYRRFSPYLLEYTGHPSVSSEALAYRLSPECRQPHTDNVSAETVIETIMAARAAGAEQLVIGITGRSGSGKSTLTREVMRRLARGGEQALTVACLSSDDYNRGKAWLEAYNQGKPWQDWDAPIAYDTVTLCHDLKRLRSGETIPRRKYDFVSQEPAIDGVVKPADIILLEGIRAGCRDLAEARDILVVLPTPPATSMGRRLWRDIEEGRINTSLGSLEDILRYQLEYVEPAHLRRLAGL